MKVNDRTTVNVESIAKRLVKAVGEAEVERIARECDLLKRKRDISPMGLLVACVSTLGVAEARWLADKTVELRIFPDDRGKMNRSLIEIGGAALVVSQFTLLGDCRKGRRPSFVKAAAPELADRLYLHYADALAERGVHVERGEFAADMQVSLINDGPVTMVIDRVRGP